MPSDSDHRGGSEAWRGGVADTSNSNQGLRPAGAEEILQARGAPHPLQYGGPTPGRRTSHTAIPKADGSPRRALGDLGLDIVEGHRERIHAAYCRNPPGEF